MLAKSDRSQSDPRSIPAMLVRTPKDTTKRHSMRMMLMKTLLLEIRFAQISVKDIKPSRQVKAKSPKQTDTSRDTAEFKAVPGVSSVTDARNFGSFPRSNQAAEASVCHTRPMTTTNPVSVQMTIVSRKVPVRSI